MPCNQRTNYNYLAIKLDIKMTDFCTFPTIYIEY